MLGCNDVKLSLSHIIYQNINYKGSNKVCDTIALF